MRSNVHEPKVKEMARAFGLLLRPLQADQRAGPVHISMYLALFQSSGGCSGWFFVNRAEVMGLAKIRGVRTYYRVIHDLVEMGVVEYWTSRDGKTGSRVRIVGPDDIRGCSAFS